MSFTFFLNNIFSRNKSGKNQAESITDDTFMGIKTYDAIQNSDVSTKAKIASNWLNSDVNLQPILIIDDLIKDNINFYNAICLTIIIAHAMIIADKNDIPVDSSFWGKIKISGLSSNNTFEELLYNTRNILELDDGWEFIFQQAAFCISDGNSKINDSIASLNNGIKIAIKNSTFRKTIFLPSAYYTIVTIGIERECQILAWGLLGFSHGEKRLVAEFHHRNEIHRQELEEAFNHKN